MNAIDWFDRPQQIRLTHYLQACLEEIACKSEREAAVSKQTDQEPIDFDYWVAISAPSPQADTVDLQIQRVSPHGEILRVGEQLTGLYPTNIAWLPDQSGFFYDRTIPLLGGHGLYFHMIGREQSDDRCVINHPEHPDWYYQPHVSPDGRWLLLTIFNQSANNRLALYPLGHDFDHLTTAAIPIPLFFRPI